MDRESNDLADFQELEELRVLGSDKVNATMKILNFTWLLSNTLRNAFPHLNRNARRAPSTGVVGLGHPILNRPLVDVIETATKIMNFDLDKYANNTSGPDGTSGTIDRQPPQLVNPLETFQSLQAKLNTQQRQVFETIRTYFSDLGPVQQRNSPPPSPKLILVTGGPGTGKSFLTNSVTKLSGLMCAGRVCTLAYTGIAAVNVHGRTISSFLGTGQNPSEEKPLDVKPEKILEFKQKVESKQLSMIVIDEISMCPPTMLALLDEMLKKERKSQTLFGGLTVMLIGDFNQTEPVRATSFTDGCVEMFLKGSQRKYTKSATSVTALRRGLEIFQKCEWTKLDMQERARTDIPHTQFIEKLGRGGKITMSDLQRYKRLSAEDNLAGGEQNAWLEAPVIVTTNSERLDLNAVKCSQFATSHRQYIIRWPSKCSDWYNKPRNEDDYGAMLENNSCFWDYFIVGAPAFFNERINRDLGIVNGTKVRYHSLTCVDNEQEEFIRCRMREQDPGTIISLARAPATVNVELVDSEHHPEEASPSSRIWEQLKIYSTDSSVVIAVKQAKAQRRDGVDVYFMGAVPGKVRVGSWFPLELGFAITAYKVQGRTLDKVIIAISRRGSPGCDFSFAMLYVALTRVRKSEDIRLLITSRDWSSLQYIPSLEPKANIRKVFAGFDADGRNWRLPA